jgi:carboxyl-terminal processing protease
VVLFAWSGAHFVRGAAIILQMNIKPSPAFMLAPVALTILVSLAGCGGGGGSADTGSATVPAPGTPVTSPVTTAPDTRPDMVKLAASCQRPRSGLSAGGVRFTDRQGTLTDELKWVRSYVDETYLWYQEVPNVSPTGYSNPIDYFDVLKTPAITASGRPKDQFHFTYATDAWEATSQNGVELGYGISWSSTDEGVLPRVWRVTMVEPGSPASAAGLRRGDTVVSVDDVSISDTSSAGIDVLNAGLLPARAGVSHRFVMRRPGDTLNVTMSAQNVSATPVQSAQVLLTQTGRIGYLVFNDHNAVAETQLIGAIRFFKEDRVDDVVLDMRYNGGGYLDIASELAYMIAGPGPTTGKVFERLRFNDKTAAETPLGFHTTAVGFPSPLPTAAGTALPYLGLKRVTLLTSPDTCSASESVINSLRGVDVEVNVIGGATCGKPYGFTPADNCGTTYFAIQFQGVNAKGYGDYADGFQPTCRASDDLSRGLGDVSESMLSAALQYRNTGVCPVMATSLAAGKSTPLRTVRPQAKAIAILRS